MHQGFPWLWFHHCRKLSVYHVFILFTISAVAFKVQSWPTPSPAPQMPPALSRPSKWKAWWAKATQIIIIPAFHIPHVCHSVDPHEIRDVILSDVILDELATTRMPWDIVDSHAISCDMGAVMWWALLRTVSSVSFQEAAWHIKVLAPVCLSFLVGLLSKQSRPYSTVLVDVTDVSANATLWKILKSWAKFWKGAACEDTFESMPLNIGEIVSYGVMQRSRHPMAFKMNLADQDQRFFCGPYVACVACLPSTQLCLV